MGPVDEYRFLHFPADAVHVDPLVFSRLPESAQRVFETVRERGPLTHADLRDVTEMPPRTIRFAVKRLRESGLLDARCSLRDCRTCYFFVHQRCVGVEAIQQMRGEAEAETGVSIPLGDVSSAVPLSLK